MVLFSELRKKKLLRIMEMVPGLYYLNEGDVSKELKQWVIYAKEKGYEGLEIKGREQTLSYKLFEAETK